MLMRKHSRTLIKYSFRQFSSTSCPVSGCGSSTSCSNSSSNTSDRIHSTDIAFKPNKDGWGYSKKYVSNYENIFGKKKTNLNEQQLEENKK